MNEYGRLAQGYTAEWRPNAYAAIKNPEEHFAMLGAEIAAEIQAQLHAIDSAPPPSTIATPGWRAAAKEMAIEAVLAEMIYYQEPEDDQDEADPEAVWREEYVALIDQQNQDSRDEDPDQLPIGSSIPIDLAALHQHHLAH